jgi:hypothetical protein
VKIKKIVGVSLGVFRDAKDKFNKRQKELGLEFDPFRMVCPEILIEDIKKENDDENKKLLDSEKKITKLENDINKLNLEKIKIDLEIEIKEKQAVIEQEKLINLEASLAQKEMEKEEIQAKENLELNNYEKLKLD